MRIEVRFMKSSTPRPEEKRAERAEQALAEGWADLIGFGRPFIANPDLVRRLREDAPLNPPDPYRGRVNLSSGNLTTAPGA